MGGERGKNEDVGEIFSLFNGRVSAMVPLSHMTRSRGNDNAFLGKFPSPLSAAVTEGGGKRSVGFFS